MLSKSSALLILLIGAVSCDPLRRKGPLASVPIDQVKFQSWCGKGSTNEHACFSATQTPIEHYWVSGGTTDDAAFSDNQKDFAVRCPRGAGLDNPISITVMWELRGYVTAWRDNTTQVCQIHSEYQPPVKNGEQIITSITGRAVKQGETIPFPVVA